MIKTIVKIEGMKCPHCEAHMTEEFKKSLGVKDVTSSHEKRESVIISGEAPDEEKVKEAVAAAGYTFVGITSEEYKKKPLLGFLKK